MTAERNDCRGGREICCFLGVSKPTAKKILRRHGILRRDGGRPLLLVDEYQKKIAETARRER